MRKIAIILFIASFVQNICAENFLTDSTIWTEYGINFYSSPYVAYKSQLMLMGDTVITDKKYKKMYTDLSYYGAIRELDGKVYANLIYNNPAGLEEVLLYDFNAEKGDTIRSNALEGPISFCLIVNSIDTVILENGEKRKRMKMTGSSDAIWIEGVGSVYGFLDPILVRPTNFTFTRLVCFKQKETVLYSNPEYCFGDCCTYKVLQNFIKTVESPDADLLVKIVNKNLEISLLNCSEVVESVSLIDANGVVVLNEKINSFGKINQDISKLKNGIYIICITSKHNTYIKKIVIG